VYEQRETTTIGNDELLFFSPVILPYTTDHQEQGRVPP